MHSVLEMGNELSVELSRVVREMESAMATGAPLVSQVDGDKGTATNPSADRVSVSSLLAVVWKCSPCLLNYKSLGISCLQTYIVILLIRLC